MIDFDIYDITNLNRQLHFSLDKFDTSKDENIRSFVTKNIDFVIDVIDDVKSKIVK